MQKGWIGHSKGYYVRMKVEVEEKYKEYKIEENIDVFCRNLN